MNLSKKYYLTLEEPFMENYKDLIHIAKKSIINNKQAVD